MSKHYSRSTAGHQVFQQALHKGVVAVCSKAFLVPVPVCLLAVPACVRQPVKSLTGTDSFTLSLAALAICASLGEHQVMAEDLKESVAVLLQDLS